MKCGRVIRWGDAVSWRGSAWRVAAEVIAPVATVYVRSTPEAPGEQIPAEEWAAATWDTKGRRWIVPPAEPAL